MPGSAPSSSDIRARTSAESSTMSTRTGGLAMSEQLHAAGRRRPGEAAVQGALDIDDLFARRRQPPDQAASGLHEECDLARLVVAQVLRDHRDLLRGQVV